MSRSFSSESYLKEMKDSSGNYLESPCRYSNVEGSGEYIEEELCGFSSLPQYTYEQYKSGKLAIPDPFTEHKGTPDKEFIDYLHEMPIIVLPKGTLLTHSTKINEIITQDKKQINPDAACWWKRLLPGQAIYKGGWFTFGKSKGPDFGLRLGYHLVADVSLLYIPNSYANIWRAQDREYFDLDRPTYDDRKYAPSYTVEDLEEEDDDEEEGTSYKQYYAGSHVIQGVKGWKAKGYEKITHEYFADKLALKLANLGFNGYISCDECEVYLTHEVMKRCLGEPDEIWTDDEQNNDRLSIIKAYCAKLPSQNLSITPVRDRDDKSQIKWVNTSII